MTENISGMIFIICAWVGSLGGGFSVVWNHMVAAIRIGRIKNGSGRDRSVIQPSQGAWRNSTDRKIIQYRPMKIGICTSMGRQPPKGLIFSSR